MITQRALIEYTKVYGPTIYYAEPSDTLVAEDEKGRVYRVLEETDEAFIALIERSARAGRNLFLVKNRRFDPYPESVAY